MPPPQRTSKPLEHGISLVGCLIPFRDGQPVLLEVGATRPYIPIFSTIEKLKGTLQYVRAPYDSIKQIEEDEGFIESIPLDVFLMKDPWRTIEGKIRFTHIY